MNKQNYNLAPETSAFSPCGLIDIPLADGAILFNNMKSLYKTRFYNIWDNVIKRGIGRDKNARYKPEGIGICNEWLKFGGFRDDMYESYLKHVEEFGEKNTSIDRIDTEGIYEPSNCRWATRLVQSRNMKSNKFITHNGEVLCLKDWSTKLEISYPTLVNRQRRGLSLEKILSQTKLDHSNYLKLEYNGQIKNALEWSRILGINVMTFRDRLKAGWSMDKIINTPVRHIHKIDYEIDPV